MVSDILNKCVVRSCEETKCQDSDLCKVHAEKRKERILTAEIKRLKIKISAINRRNELVVAGHDPAPFRNVWIVEGKSWIYT